MPDLTLETRLTCASNLYFEYKARGKLGDYHVVYGPLPRGERYGYGWQCSCPAYQFSKRNTHGLKECKHTKEAEKHRCGYGWEAMCGGNPQPNVFGWCPQCGGEMEPVQVGV